MPPLRENSSQQTFVCYKRCGRPQGDKLKFGKDPDRSRRGQIDALGGGQSQGFHHFWNAVNPAGIEIHGEPPATLEQLPGKVIINCQNMEHLLQLAKTLDNDYETVHRPLNRRRPGVQLAPRLLTLLQAVPMSWREGDKQAGSVTGLRALVGRNRSFPPVSLSEPNQPGFFLVAVPSAFNSRRSPKKTSHRLTAGTASFESAASTSKPL